MISRMNNGRGVNIMTQQFSEMTIPIVIMGCLVSGYLFNTYFTVEFKNIPIIMALIGILINLFLNGFINYQFTIVYGALNGLISTGMYEAFKNMINKTKG